MARLSTVTKISHGGLEVTWLRQNFAHGVAPQIVRSHQLTKAMRLAAEKQATADRLKHAAPEAMSRQRRRLFSRYGANALPSLPVPGIRDTLPCC